MLRTTANTLAAGLLLLGLLDSLEVILPTRAIDGSKLWDYWVLWSKRGFYMNQSVNGDLAGYMNQERLKSSGRLKNGEILQSAFRWCVVVRVPYDGFRPSIGGGQSSANIFMVKETFPSNIPTTQSFVTS
ncbi:unnamed protein product [Boreogadus saida]